MSDTTTDAVVKQVWFEPSWLFWDQMVDGRSLISNDANDRPYEIQQHASDRLTGDPGDLDRVDAITTLRRAVAYRVRVLKEIYELRKLPISPKPRYDLELLASFDIIRPFMLKRLIDIRNIVEHQDSKPPSTEECLMFADLVWYFLRSTDSLVRGRVTDLLFYPPGTDPESRVFYPSVRIIFPDNFSAAPQVWAWLRPSGFSYQAVMGWIKVEVNEIINHENDDPRSQVMGKMLGTGEQMRLLYEAYFRHGNF